MRRYFLEKIQQGEDCLARGRYSSGCIFLSVRDECCSFLQVIWTTASITWQQPLSFAVNHKVFSVSFNKHYHQKYFKNWLFVCRASLRSVRSVCRFDDRANPSISVDARRRVLVRRRAQCNSDRTRIRIDQRQIFPPKPNIFLFAWFLSSLNCCCCPNLNFTPRLLMNIADVKRTRKKEKKRRYGNSDIQCLSLSAWEISWNKLLITSGNCQPVVVSDDNIMSFFKDEFLFFSEHFYFFLTSLH